MDDADPRPLTGGAVMTAVSRVTVAATGALTTILIARLLGPDGSGGYFLAQSIVLLLTVATTLGLEHGIAYYVSAGQWSPGAAMRTALRVATITGAAGLALGMVARQLFPDAFAGLTVTETLVASAGLPFWLAWFYATYVALADDRYEAYAVPPALQSVLAMVLAGGGAIAFDLPGAIAGMTIATAVVGVGAAGWGLRRLRQAAAPEPPGNLRRAISFGFKGYAANALQLLNYRIDLFILSAVAATAEVGHYAVAVSVAQVLWLLPQAVSDILFPRVAHLTARDAHEHREMVEVKSARHVVLAAVVGALVLALALVVLIVPVYGADFRPAIDLALILLPGIALIGVSAVLNATVVGRGRPIYALYGVLITTPPTIVLYAVLIPAHGAEGAAVASTLSYSANFVVAAWFYRRVTGRRLLRTLTPTRSELHDFLALPAAVAARVRRAG